MCYTQNTDGQTQPFIYTDCNKDVWNVDTVRPGHERVWCNGQMDRHSLLFILIVMRTCGMLTLWRRDMRGCDVTRPVISWTSALRWHLHLDTDWIWDNSRHHLSFLREHFHLFQYLRKILYSLKLWFMDKDLTHLHPKRWTWYDITGHDQRIILDRGTQKPLKCIDF